MTITRIEKDGQPLWQAILTDEEIRQLVLSVLTGLVSNGETEAYRLMSEVIIDTLVSDAVAKDSEVLSALTRIRDHHAPARFVVDVTTLVRENSKPQ